MCVHAYSHHAAHQPCAETVQTGYLRPCDLHRVDVADDVQEVVCLINDDYIPFERNAHSLPCGSMQQRVIGHHNELAGIEGRRGEGGKGRGKAEGMEDRGERRGREKEREKEVGCL